MTTGLGLWDLVGHRERIIHNCMIKSLILVYNLCGFQNFQIPAEMTKIERNVFLELRHQKRHFNMLFVQVWFFNSYACGTSVSGRWTFEGISDNPLIDRSLRSKIFIPSKKTFTEFVQYRFPSKFGLIKKKIISH